MEEDESFDEFYAKLKDIINSAFNLRETIPEPKVVRKVLKSLPGRFHAKITATEESKDIEKIPLTELVGNFQTYEEDLVDSKFEKMDDQDHIHTTYENLYKVSKKHEKLYRLATKKLIDVELDQEELSTKFDEAN